ncbi:MAG: Clp protease N-terminal domain-containing protein [Anaerolineales bacterium]
MTLHDRRYSQHARRSLVRARLLAQEFQHAAVDTDHVLLGIWHTEGSLGYRVLAEGDISRARAEETVRRLHPEVVYVPDPMPYSDTLQSVLLYAVDESNWLGQHYIGTEHILLGLVRAGTGQLSALLLELGISTHQIRQRVRRLLSEGAYESTYEAIRRSARLSELSRRVLNATNSLARTYEHPTASLEHLLLVLWREKRSMVAHVLVQAGLQAHQLQADLEQLHIDAALAMTAFDEILARSVDLAESFGTHYTGTDHLLLALVEDDEGRALLRRYGANTGYLSAVLREQF